MRTRVPSASILRSESILEVTHIFDLDDLAYLCAFSVWSNSSYQPNDLWRATEQLEKERTVEDPEWLRRGSLFMSIDFLFIFLTLMLLLLLSFGLGGGDRAKLLARHVLCTCISGPPKPTYHTLDGNSLGAILGTRPSLSTSELTSSKMLQMSHMSHLCAHRCFIQSPLWRNKCV